jgi:DNA-binding phage protein
MSDTDTIKKLRRAARHRQRADALKHKATEQLRDYMRQADGEGVPIARIAREAGLSRQGVYELLDRQPS